MSWLIWSYGRYSIRINSLILFSEDAEYQFALDNDGKKIAKDELHELDSDRAAAVQAFRQWVLEQNPWLKAPTGNRKNYCNNCKIIPSSFIKFMNGLKYSINA